MLANGQVMYYRWDYTGINHIFLRELMVMNPDGTGQRAVYGSNSWFPNSLYFPAALPGEPNQFVCILSGYHGPHRMGQLVLIDTGRGWHEAAGLVKRISGRGDPIRPQIRDDLVGDDWPKFLHPYPLSDKHFLVAGWTGPQVAWGIYLADVFDNLVLVREEPGYALLEPVPIRASADAARDSRSRRPDAATTRWSTCTTSTPGPGLEGVPRGTVKSLRVLAYHFGYPGLAGPDQIGCGGPWEVMRILGTVPVEADGSASFRVPANTPLALQALDAEGKAVQLMRSWVTAMPGEKRFLRRLPRDARDTAAQRLASAAVRPPATIVPWHGPAARFRLRARGPAGARSPLHLRATTGSGSARRSARPDQVPDYRGRN